MRLTLLGSTGSIGQSTLGVVRQKPEQFSVHALVAGRNVSALLLQILEFRPQRVVVADDLTRSAVMDELQAKLPRSEWPELGVGTSAQVEAATDSATDFVLSAIVGIAGLQATYAAICRHKRIGLANKEALVSSGALVMSAVRESGSILVPVDSEHNGAHQCFRAGTRQEITKLLLTASGGPFRETPKEQLWAVTREQALNHPTWKMGERITIDSATMMNKGFEVIEACWLFDLLPSQVEVVIHPQSTIHAMVEFVDGSIVAQLSATDMRMPIQYALTFPERQQAPVSRVDWRQAKTWTFSPPDFDRFPLLQLAYQALKQGGSAGCTLNAADEIAVQAFLEAKIPFPAIAWVVRETLERQGSREMATIEEVLSVDAEARAVAAAVVATGKWRTS